MSTRFWLTVVTFFFVALVVFFGWPQIYQAWGLLGRVNIWILMLLIPLQFISYYAVGETMFSYLRSKGDLKAMSRFKMTRITLELNFLNHIFPVPAAAGFSYLNWLLRHHDVSTSRSTMAQIIRYMLSFFSFVLLLVMSVFVMAFDYKIDRLIIIIILASITILVGLFAFLVYSISNKKRVMKLSVWLVRATNKIVGFFTRGRKKGLLKYEKVGDFFIGLHQDYSEILKDKKVLLVPFLWSILAMAIDATLILIAFWSLGFWVNPAAIFIAFSLSSIVTTIFSVTPGGAGVYETVMITFLASTGVSADIAIAGTLVARAALLLGTIGFGYIFYQLTINKYGKISNSANL